MPASLQTLVAAATGLIVVLGLLLTGASLAPDGPRPQHASLPLHLVAAVPFLYLVGVPVSLLLNWLLVRFGPGRTLVDLAVYAFTWAFLPYLMLVPGEVFLPTRVQALFGLLLGSAHYGLIRGIAGDPRRERAATYAGGAVLVGLAVARFLGVW
jgi:hypothetical protein